MGEEAFEKFERAWRESIAGEKTKYIQMTKDLLYMYPGQKYILANAKNPDEFEGLPQELVREYNKRIHNAKFLIGWIEEALDRIKLLEHNAVIDMFYFQLLSCPEIAEQLYCNERTVHRWKEQFIKELSIILFGVDALELEAL